MEVTRTERHCFEMTNELYDVCHRSKNLYNAANYLKRQAFFRDEEPPTAYTIIKQFTANNQPDYRALPAQTAQQTLRLLDKDWTSYTALQKEWDNDPIAYLKRRHLPVSKLKEKPNFGKPRVPHYKEKDGVAPVMFTNQQMRIRDGKMSFPAKAGLSFCLRTKVSGFHQVRIVPKYGVVFIEVVYDIDMPAADVDSDNILSIDLGVNNIATCFSSIGRRPFIVNGRPLKAINQFFNKQRSSLMSFVGDKGTSHRIEKLTHKRNMMVSDYLHKTSSVIRQYCIDNRIGTVVIGKNDGWKQSVNIGKRNNQKFVFIPHSTLVEQLQYKLGDIGINVLLQEESYTSKVDHLAFESMEHHVTYQGKRVKRGLFQSSTGKRLNADCNGAIGIMRKVIGDVSLRELLDRGCVFQPLKINIV